MHRQSAYVLFSLLTSFSMFACALDDSGVDMLDDEQLRSVKVTDRWGLLDPTHFPDVNSCDDYWNDRCANLTPSQCTVAKNRYKCTNTDMGVMITDGFATATEAVAWEGLSLGDDVGSPAPNPHESCESMYGLEYEHCVGLADLATFVAEQVPSIRESVPEGGISRIEVFEDHIMMRASMPGEAFNLLDDAAGALGWTAPLLEGEYEFEYHVSPAVYEDNIIFMIAPNGIAGMGKEVIVFMQKGE